MISSLSQYTEDKGQVPDQVRAQAWPQVRAQALGWAEKQKMWNIDCAHADPVDIHKTEGSYISTFHFNTIAE